MPSAFASISGTNIGTSDIAVDSAGDIIATWIGAQNAVMVEEISSSGVILEGPTDLFAPTGSAFIFGFSDSSVSETVSGGEIVAYLAGPSATTPSNQIVVDTLNPNLTADSALTTITGAEYTGVDVAGTADDGFIVGFVSDTTNSSGIITSRSVYVQTYNADGVMVGSPVQLYDESGAAFIVGYRDVGVAASAGGGGAVAYLTAPSSTSPANEIVIQSISPSGVIVGSPIDIAAAADVDFYAVDLSIDAQGDYVVSYGEEMRNASGNITDRATVVDKYSTTGQEIGSPILLWDESGSFFILGDRDTSIATSPNGTTIAASITAASSTSPGNAISLYDIEQPLFTPGDDTVDFNNLTTNQIAAINNGASLYDTLAGNDTVTLPDVANYQLTSSVAWDPTQTFTMGDGDDTLSAGDGDYNIALGAGNDTVTITGDGSSTISAGSGTDTFNLGDGTTTVTGGGTYTLNIGSASGSDQVGGATMISGNGAATINLQNVNDTVDVDDTVSANTINVIGAGVSDSIVLTDGGNVVDLTGASEDVTVVVGSASAAVAALRNDPAGGASATTLSESIILNPQQPNAILNLSLLTNNPTIQISGFVSGDDINIIGSSSLTLTAQFNGGSPVPTTNPANPEVDIYSGATQVATLEFMNLPDNFIDTLFPTSSSVNGMVATAIAADSSTCLEDPTAAESPAGTSIDWSGIHASETTTTTFFDAALLPFIPNQGASGLTVGQGVDLGQQPLSLITGALNTWSSAAGSTWQNDYNLVDLTKFVGKKTPAVALQEMELLFGDNIYDSYNSNGTIGRYLNETFSVTESQSDAITHDAELSILDQTFNDYSNSGPSAIWSAIGQYALPGYFNGASIPQTVLYDLEYNKGHGAASTPAFEDIEDGDYKAAAQAVLAYSYLNPARWQADSDALLAWYHHTNPSQPISITVDPLTPSITSSNPYCMIKDFQGQVQSSSATNFVFGLFGDPPGPDFEFNVSNGSPLLASLTLSEDAPSYQVSYLEGSTWTVLGDVAGGSQLNFSGPGASAIRVNMLGVSIDTAAPVPGFDMTATFASSGAFSGVGESFYPGDDRFEATSQSDVLIENTNGALVVGEVAASGQLAYSQIGGLGPEWRFVGSGDLLGDGNTGFLIEDTSGALVVGEIAGGQASYTQVAALGPEWSFHGTGDFLGVGATQFLIENTAGALVIGDIVNGQATYSQVAGLGPEWSFEGTGDFLGDGVSDFLIENTAGAVFVGEVGSGGQASYTQVAALGPEWKFVGTGDFLGDGKSDFLIENASGAVVVGEVQSGVATYTQIGGLGPEWSFVGEGDYGGTGRDSFLIENTSGAVFTGTVVNGAAQYAQIGALGREWSFHG
jgi:hypothetical protein